MNKRYKDIDCIDNKLDFNTCIELINYFIDEYIKLHNIESLEALTQMQFHAVLFYVFQHAFCKQDPKKYYRKSILDYSNSELLYNLCVYYIYYLAIPNNKVISVYQYSAFVGLDWSVIYNWKDEKNDIFKHRIYKMLYELRQQTISDKLLSDNYKSPVALIAVLNHEYNWSQNGSVIINNNTISANDLKSISSRYNAGDITDHSDNNIACLEDVQNLTSLPAGDPAVLPDE